MDVRLDRNFRRIYDSEDFSNYPCSPVGTVAFLANNGEAAETIAIYDSVDGATWEVVPFSTPEASAQLSVTLQPRARAALLFRTNRPYLRFIADPPCEGGVFLQLVQWNPAEPLEVTEAYGY